MRKYLAVFLVIASLSLLGAGCKKVAVVWPEECQKEIALPSSFPEKILYSNARVIEDPEKGGTSTVFFCSPDDQEQILGWYKELLKDYKNIEILDALVVGNLYTWNQGVEQETVVLAFVKSIDNFSIFAINTGGFN